MKLKRKRKCRAGWSLVLWAARFLSRIGFACADCLSSTEGYSVVTWYWHGVCRGKDHYISLRTGSPISGSPSRKKGEMDIDVTCKHYPSFSASPPWNPTFPVRSISASTVGPGCRQQASPKIPLHHTHTHTPYLTSVTRKETKETPSLATSLPTPYPPPNATPQRFRSAGNSILRRPRRRNSQSAGSERYPRRNKLPHERLQSDRPPTRPPSPTTITITIPVLLGRNTPLPRHPRRCFAARLADQPRRGDRKSHGPSRCRGLESGLDENPGFLRPG